MLFDRLFFESEEERDRRCLLKDDILVSILKNMLITVKSALLMPCLYGRELRVLDPSTRIFALERNPKIYKQMRKRLPRLRMPPKPMDASRGIDFAIAETPQGFDLVYLDFLSKISMNHVLLLEKLFKLRALNKGAKLILTFGNNRSWATTKWFNTLLMSKNPKCTAAMICVDAMIEKTGHRLYTEKPKEHYYKSGEGNAVHNFVTTEVQF